MKKLMVFGLALAVVLGLGFNVMAAGHMEDGIYTGYSSASDRAYVEANVSIQDGAIVNVELTEWRNTGIAKDEDYGWDEFHEAMEVLPERFVEANSADVDIITGATSTSEMAIEAVEMALTKAENVRYMDGRFMGHSSVSSRGGLGVAWVTLEDGEIVDVKLEEVQEQDGERVLKDEDYGWDEFHEAREEMPEWFVDANSPFVDVYTEATGSSNMWMEAVADALSKARY